MTEQDTVIERKIRLLKKHTDELATLTPSDGGIADACGLTREIEVQLQTIRRSWEKVAATEIDPTPTYKQPDSRRQTAPVATGAKYELVPKTKTVRSYNTPAILASLMAADEDRDLFGALKLALEVDAVRLTWRLTPLKKLLKAEHAPLRIAFNPVNDHTGVDGALIGETETPDGVTRVRIEG